MHQVAAPAPKSAHAVRVRPLERTAATARLTAAMPAATASPMSSIAIVVCSPPKRKICQTRKAAHTIATRAAATANRLHSRVRARRHTETTRALGEEPPGAVLIACRP